MKLLFKFNRSKSDDNIISFRTAKLLSEFKFNKLCKFSYDEDGVLSANAEQMCNFKAPTQAILEDWLKKEYNLIIIIGPISISCGNKFGKRYRYYITKSKSLIMKDISLLGFYSKEEALEIALFECLKYIKDNEINV